YKSTTVEFAIKISSYGKLSVIITSCNAVREQKYGNCISGFGVQLLYPCMNDSKELQAWIDAINFVAASLSAPPMPGAVGSQKKFQRPLLPCSITKLNVVEQLEDHSARVNQIESELNDLKTNPLDKNAKSATVSSHKEKLAYLTSESLKYVNTYILNYSNDLCKYSYKLTIVYLRRYQTYVHLLRSRLESSSGVSKVMVGGVVNPLPVFDGVEVKEVGPEEAGDPSSGGGIVPPQFPRDQRDTPTDSIKKMN
ncbi:hypothetical protein Avbf_04434, partial [Armadillidium vulgare]